MNGRIEYADVNIGSDGIANIYSASSSNFQPFALPAQLKSLALQPVDFQLSLQDYVRLDGTREWITSDYQSKDWGALSVPRTQSNTRFPTPLSFNVQFPLNVRPNINGISFLFNKFDDSWCNDLDIELWLYDNSNQDIDYSNWPKLIHFAPDSVDYYCDMQENYVYQMRVTFNGMNKADRFLWVQRFAFGKVYVFGPEQLMSHNVLSEFSVTSEDLPINSLNFSLMLPVSNTIPFNKRRPVYSYFRNDLQGVFYLEDADRALLNIWNLKAYDILGYLNGIGFDGGMYTSVTASDLIQKIKDVCHIDIQIEPSLALKTLTGWLPVDTCRYALMQVAFATGGVIHVDKEKIYVREIKDTVSSHFSADRIMLGAQVKKDQSVVKEVRLSSFAYVKQLVNRNLLESINTEGGQEYVTYKQGWEVTGLLPPPM